MGEWRNIRKAREGFPEVWMMIWELLERGLPCKGTCGEKEHLGQKLQHVRRLRGGRTHSIPEKRKGQCY